MAASRNNIMTWMLLFFLGTFHTVKQGIDWLKSCLADILFLCTFCFFVYHETLLRDMASWLFDFATVSMKQCTTEAAHKICWKTKISENEATETKAQHDGDGSTWWGRLNMMGSAQHDGDGSTWWDEKRTPPLSVNGIKLRKKPPKFKIPAKYLIVNSFDWLVDWLPVTKFFMPKTAVFRIFESFRELGQPLPVGQTHMVCVWINSRWQNLVSLGWSWMILLQRWPVQHLSSKGKGTSAWSIDWLIVSTYLYCGAFFPKIQAL